MNRLIVSVLIVVAAALVAVHPPADAAPSSPQIGDRVAITLFSDSRTNLLAGWVDSANQPRTQKNPVLTTFDPRSKRWSSTLTFTSQAALADLAVFFQTGGGLAGCVVTVNGVRAADDTVYHHRAIATCV